MCLTQGVSSLSSFQDILNQAVNDVLKTRPADPMAHISKFLAAKAGK